MCCCIDNLLVLLPKDKYFKWMAFIEKMLTFWFSWTVLIFLLPNADLTVVVSKDKNVPVIAIWGSARIYGQPYQLLSYPQNMAVRLLSV